MKAWVIAFCAWIIEKYEALRTWILGPAPFVPTIPPVAPPPVGPIPPGPPQLPAAFYGVARINGKPAPLGTEVCAIVAGVKYPVLGNPVRVYDKEGRFGGPTLNDPKLVVQGPAVRAGDPIKFYIGNWPCWCGGPSWAPHVSFPFKAGDVLSANLWLGNVQS